MCTYTGDGGKVLAGGEDFNRYYFEVKVADNVAAPVVLGGGVFTVENVVEEPSVNSRSAAAPSSKTVTRGKVGDIDPSDNSDDFSAYVGKKGGAGGGLPVTGTQVSVIAGVGLGAVVLGGVLFLATRRRRVTA